MQGRQNASSIAPPSPPWVDLPAEITMDILQRLGTIEILESVQRVCNTWWKLCHDPAIWRVVDLKYDPDSMSVMPHVLKKICQIAVDRSQGQLFKINIENFGSKELLNYIAQRSTQLRILRVVMGFYDFAGGLAADAKNLPYLEELHMHFTFITEEDIQSVGRSCPLLKSFILNASDCDLENSLSPDDGQALAIATSMPELRHLALILNNLTNVGLQAILDGCPHLVWLDLRHCNIDLEGDLGRRCRQQIVDLKQPHASTQDYEFDSEVSYYLDYWSSHEYKDYRSDDDHVYSDSDNGSW